MSVPIHRDPVQYTSADEVAWLNKLFAQDLPIIAACNRVQARTERDKGRQWYFGLAWGSVAALVAFLTVWWGMQP